MQKKSKRNVFTFMMLIILSLTFQPAISIYAACPEDISSYWKLDETTPGTYEDFIKDNDGTGNANPTVTADGIINGAQTFDGTTTGIDVEPDRSLNWTVDESFSIEFWVKRDGDVTGENQVAIGRIDPGSSLVWWVGIGDDTDATTDQNMAAFVLQDSDGGDLVTVKGTKDITDNEWHHVVAVRDSTANEILLYVDGETPASATTSYDAGFDSATADINIGYLDAGTLFQLAGGLDEVALYDRALTADEIEDHYEDGLEGIGIEDTVSTTIGDIAAGDFTGDGKEDVASVWPSGFWYQDGDTLAWKKISGDAPSKVTAGDVTGDGRDEIIGTWSNGIWFRDVAASNWTKMTSAVPDGDIAAGDFTGDGKEDVASVWPDGLWYQDGDTLAWKKISGDAPNKVTAGDVTGDGRDEIIGTWSNGIWYRDVAASNWTKMTSAVPDGDIAAGDFTGDGKEDVASVWPDGLWYQDGDTLAWKKISGDAPNKVTAGDVTGDGRDEIIGTWSSGIWYWDVVTSTWTQMARL